MKRVAGSVLLLVALVTVGIGAQESPETGEAWPREWRPGIIFNAPNLLLDIDDYQGGVGAKLVFDAFALRALFSLGLENVQGDSPDSSFNVSTGVSVEVPFVEGRVQPYWGALLDGSFASEQTESSDGDKSETTVVGGSLGPLIGVEVSVFQFLSLFAEYTLAFRIAHTSVEQEAGGVSSSDESTNYELGTELGNTGALGIVVYLVPAD